MEFPTSTMYEGAYLEVQHVQASFLLSSTTKPIPYLLLLLLLLLLAVPECSAASSLDHFSSLVESLVQAALVELFPRRNVGDDHNYHHYQRNNCSNAAAVVVVDQRRHRSAAAAAAAAAPKLLLFL